MIAPSPLSADTVPRLKGSLRGGEGAVYLQAGHAGGPIDMKVAILTGGGDCPGLNAVNLDPKLYEIAEVLFG